MTTQTVFRDSGSGEFVSAEYAAEHPDTTYVTQQRIGPQTTQLEDYRAELIRMTGSQPVYELTVMGDRFSNVDPTEVTRLALEHVRRALGVEG